MVNILVSLASNTFKATRSGRLRIEDGCVGYIADDVVAGGCGSAAVAIVLTAGLLLFLLSLVVTNFPTQRPKSSSR